ncbi:MAG: group III truncated hemoglobin [Bacteroidetes bacterium]|nr:group III truncated hemoglobin [Bacteroidota bacterium]
MKKDIKTRRDIELLVDRFYKNVRADHLLGPVFDDIAKVNWEKHLRVMYDFWDNTIFFSGTYSGNPMHLHQHLHERFSLNSTHFERWNELFDAVVDELYSGTNALLAKQRAASIAAVIKSKILPNGKSR